MLMVPMIGYTNPAPAPSPTSTIRKCSTRHTQPPTDVISLLPTPLPASLSPSLTHCTRVRAPAHARGWRVEWANGRLISFVKGGAEPPRSTRGKKRCGGGSARKQWGGSVRKQTEEGGRGGYCARKPKIIRTDRGADLANRKGESSRHTLDLCIGTQAVGTRYPPPHTCTPIKHDRSAPPYQEYYQPDKENA